MSFLFHQSVPSYPDTALLSGMISPAQLRELFVEVRPRVKDPLANRGDCGDNRGGNEGGNQDVLDDVLPALFTMQLLEEVFQVFHWVFSPVC
jgi:hypothetical protein